MQIRIDGVRQSDGSLLYDLVLVQGEQQIRLGLTAPNATRAAAELATWLEDNTIDVWEIVRSKDAPVRNVRTVPA